MISNAFLRIFAVSALALGIMTCGVACKDAGNPTVATDAPGATSNVNDAGPTVPGNVVPAMGGASTNGVGVSGGGASAGSYH